MIAFLPVALSHPLKERPGSDLSALRSHHGARRGRIRLSRMSDPVLGDAGLARHAERYVERARFRKFVG